MSVAESIPAALVLEKLRACKVTDVIAVPDTHQRTLIDLLLKAKDIRFIQTATEDEAIGVACGLIVGGRRPLVQIQHAGMYASVNNLRGIGIDGEFPLVFLTGLLSRDPAKPPRENFGSMLRYAEPLLDALEIPHFLLDHPEDLHYIDEAYKLAEERPGPVVVFVGERTS